ncbi:MAG: hypothetical protein R8K47_05785, partial [Mariprofundaceae bacterium]
EVSTSSESEFTDSLRIDALDLGGAAEPEGVADENEGDFTSTIRTTLDDIGAEAPAAQAEDEFTSTGGFDLDETVAVTPGDAGGTDEGGVLDLDLEDDEEATQQLDSLLKEFTDEEEKKKDQD